MSISESSGAQIAGIKWYDGVEGYIDPWAPTLAVAFSSGHVQLMRGDEDDCACNYFEVLYRLLRRANIHGHGDFSEFYTHSHSLKKMFVTVQYWDLVRGHSNFHNRQYPHPLPFNDFMRGGRGVGTNVPPF